MRLYTFMHCYISQIQGGIQTSHVQGELANQIFNQDDRYCINNKKTMIKDWSTNHKTIIVCNGGNSAMLKDLCSFFSSLENPYPWAEFREDEDSMEGMRTGVGIILPEEIYDVDVEFKYGTGSKSKERIKEYSYNCPLVSVIYNDPESYTYQLIDKVKSARLF